MFKSHLDCDLINILWNNSTQTIFCCCMYILFYFVDFNLFLFVHINIHLLFVCVKKRKINILYKFIVLFELTTTRFKIVNVFKMIGGFPTTVCNYLNSSF